jgi:hypothetical protein
MLEPPFTRVKESALAIEVVRVNAATAISDSTVLRKLVLKAMVNPF